MPREELAAISADLEPVNLPFKQVLHEPLEPITHVYFVERRVISLVNEPEDGNIIELATIGPEGMAGFQVVLGTLTIPSRGLVQVPGEGLRMRIADFERLLPRVPQLHKMLLRHTMGLLNQISQSTSCNRFHEVQERCARWLLQTHDRVERDTFPLTQEFLSQMLGVHRPTGSVAAGMHQHAGLIQYNRGQITIVDRKGLETASCSCYRTVKDEYERMLDPAPEPSVAWRSTRE